MGEAMRRLWCTSCGENVRVYEEPVEFLDPATYVCGECMRPVEVDRQIEFTPDREETRSYDPAIAAIPF